MHRARVARARGFDSLPSLNPDPRTRRSRARRAPWSRSAGQMHEYGCLVCTTLYYGIVIKRVPESGSSRLTRAREGVRELGAVHQLHEGEQNLRREPLRAIREPRHCFWAPRDLISLSWIKRLPNWSKLRIMRPPRVRNFDQFSSFFIQDKYMLYTEPL
jgi:hypothetical protein